MRKQLATLIATSVIAAPAWTAESGNGPKEEKIGLGSGAAIGAIAGGPVGLILGAGLGGWLGERFHVHKSARAASEVELAETTLALAAAEDRARARERSIGELRAAMGAERRGYREAISEALSIELYFRTGESRLDAAAEERIARVAKLLNGLEDYDIVVEGHADGRGDADYNAELSTARATAVRDVLLRNGVAASRITAEGEGDTLSVADEKDLDALALERRVQLTIVGPAGSGRVAGR